jgi:nucleotide-binding universal stress UspA family protein
MPGIVVGVDGSQRSQRSLEWAMREAGLRQVPLTVLAVHPVALSTWTHTPITFPADKTGGRERPHGSPERRGQGSQ